MDADQKAVLLSVPTTATRLDIGRTSVYRLVYAGELDYVPTGTGSRPRVRIVEASLEAYIARKIVVGRRAAATGPQGVRDGR